MFVFNSGQDTITDFDVTQDSLEISASIGQFASLEDLLAFATVAQNDLTFAFADGATLTLEGISEPDALLGADITFDPLVSSGNADFGQDPFPLF